MKKYFSILLILLLSCVLLLTSCVETGSNANQTQSNLNNDPTNTTTPNKPTEENPSLEETPAEQKTYLLTYKATLVSNDSVGDSWSSGVLYGTKNIYSYIPISDTLVSGPTFTLYATEDDSRDDVGKIDITFSDLRIGEKETKTQRLNVRENEGKYIGNTAVWEFTITCSRVDNNYQNSTSTKYSFEGGLCKYRDDDGMPREILTSFQALDSIKLAAKINGIPDESVIVVVWILPNNRVQEQRFEISSGEVLNASCYSIYVSEGNAIVQVILEETQELIKAINFSIN